MLSDYQLAVIDDIESGSGNTGVNAVAGSGKTFTICKGAGGISRVYSVLMAAFGKDIAAELRTRNLPSNCKIYTYNSFGWGLVLQNFSRRPTLEENKTEQFLQHVVLKAEPENTEAWKEYLSLKYTVKRLVSLLKGNCVFNIDEVPNRVPEFVEHYGMEVQIPIDRLAQIVTDTYKACNEAEWICDYDDQIFFPLLKNLSIPRFDYVFVDEFQDTNLMQSMLMQRASEGGRFFGVGDPDQAIYGFRGATPDAFGQFLKQFSAKELPLSICYRCPKAVIAEAQKIVPRIEAASEAIQGTVDHISTTDFFRNVQPGDYVICRTVAPLVKRCLQHIREGIPAKILGKNLTEELEYLINKISGQSNFMSISTFKSKLDEHYVQKMNVYKALQQDNLALILEDKHQAIVAFMEDCNIVGDLFKRITSVMDRTDAVRSCVRYMTAHKSKGLECDQNTYILRPDLMPHPRAKKDWMVEEERRVKYVAITRAKKGLFWVRKEQNEK